MNGTNSRQNPGQPLSAGRPKGFARLTSIARRLRKVIGEMNYAQQRLIARLMSFDPEFGLPDNPPETYAEFLLRSSGPLHREPSAQQRSAGRAVR